MISSKDIGDILKNLYDTYGNDLIKDARRVNAFLMDYLPENNRERKLIVSVLKEGVGNKLKQVIDSDMETQQDYMSQCKNKIMTNLWITEEAAFFAVETIAYSLGICVQNNQERQKQLFRLILTLKAMQNKRNQNMKEFIQEKLNHIDSKGNFLKEYNVIGFRAFEGNTELTELTIPSNIVAIKSEAFLQCKRLHTITLPNSLETIEKDIFKGCVALNKIKLSNTPVENKHFVIIEGVLYNKNKTQLIKYPSGRREISYILEDSVRKIADGAFGKADYLESITFNNELEEIGMNAFRYCKKLNSILLPAGIQKIGESAFEWCINLKYVMLPRSIQKIDSYAFRACQSIESINLSQNMQSIGCGAFMNCKRLKRVMIQENVSFIGENAFSGCSPNLEILVRNNPYVMNYCKARGIVCKVK